MASQARGSLETVAGGGRGQPWASPGPVQDAGAGLRSEYNQVRAWSGVQEPGDRRHGKWAGL